MNTIIIIYNNKTPCTLSNCAVVGPHAKDSLALTFGKVIFLCAPGFIQVNWMMKLQMKAGAP